MAIARGSTLAPFTAAIGRRYGRYPTPRLGASRVVQGNVQQLATTKASPYVGDPYSYRAMYTGRFAGRRYPYPPIEQHRRLGQDFFGDIASLFTPNPGGGSVTTHGGSYTDPYSGQTVTVPTGTSYVNSAGLDQSTLDPNAGATLLSAPGAVLSEDFQGGVASVTGIDALNPQSPSYNPNAKKYLGWALGAAAVLVVAKVAHFL